MWPISIFTCLYDQNFLLLLANIISQDCFPDVQALGQDEAEDHLGYDTLILFKDNSCKNKEAWTWALGFESSQAKESWLKELTHTVLAAKTLHASSRR